MEFGALLVLYVCFTGFAIDAEMRVNIEQCTVQSWHGTALIESKGQSECSNSMYLIT